MAVLPVDSTATARAPRSAVPIRSAFGLLAAAGVVAAVDPSDTRGVPCPLHALTGWWCPGCGLTRGTHHLLHGDVVGALRYNALLPLVLATITLLWIDCYATATGRRSLLRAMPAWWPLPGVVIAVAFAVLRNLPGVEGLRG